MNTDTIKTRARRTRNALRMRYDEALCLIEEASHELNDSQVLKVMKLAFGITQFLGPDHCYHEEEWPALARVLKLHSATELLSLVLDAHVFLFVEGRDEGNRAFYFPDYKNFHDCCDRLICKAMREKELKEDETPEPMLEENETLTPEPPVRSEKMNAIIDVLKENLGCEEVSQVPMPASDSCSDSCTDSCTDLCANRSKTTEANSQISTPVAEPHARVGTGTGNKGVISLEEITPKEQEMAHAVEACVGRLWKAESPDGPLHCVRKLLLEKLSLSAEGDGSLAKVAFGYLVRCTLAEHFGYQRRRKEHPRDFRLLDEQGQDSWLLSLLTSKYGGKILHDAAEGVRPMLSHARFELSHQHPNGPHEWFDPACSQRFYDDPTEGPTLIPEGLEPRPSAEARLHPVTGQWII